VALILIGFGAPEEHAAAVATARDALQPLFDVATPMPYVVLQQMLDDGAHWGIRAYTKGLYLDELPEAAIDTLAARLPGRSSLGSQVLVFPFPGGAVGDVPDDATAFGGSRSLQYVIAVECMAGDEETFAHDRQWVRDTWNALRPAAVHDGAYVNLMAEFEGDSLRHTYGPAKFDRLREIKAQYDPTNVFRHNAKIPRA
jgi:Berberine and berberine like